MRPVMSRKEAKEYLEQLPEMTAEYEANNKERERLSRQILKSCEVSQYLKLMYVWGHSYEFDNNDNWDVIENFCKYMGGRDDIWYATNIEIIDYMDAAKRLQFSADYEKVYNPNACSVWLQLNSDKCVEIEGGTLVDLNTLL